MTHGTPMALVGKLHPLVVHFPIGLVLAAAAAEIAAIAAADHQLRRRASDRPSSCLPWTAMRTERQQTWRPTCVDL
jgi:uncharacterized membrane protein